MSPKLLTDGELKEIREWASSDETKAKDVYRLLEHIEEMNRCYFCKHHWEYHFEIGFVCDKCQTKRQKI